MTLTPLPPRKILMSEMLRDQIEQSKKVMTDKRERFAEFRGTIKAVQRMPQNDLTIAIATLWTFMMDESEVRMQEHISLLESMKVMAEKMEEGLGFFETKTTNTNILVEAMLGVSDETPEKEIMERAKESGEIYSEVSRRRRGEK